MHTFLKIATVLLLTSFIPHKYYVTIAEINYNSQQRYFETSIKAQPLLLPLPSDFGQEFLCQRPKKPGAVYLFEKD